MSTGTATTYHTGPLRVVALLVALLLGMFAQTPQASATGPGSGTPGGAAAVAAIAPGPGLRSPGAAVVTKRPSEYPCAPLDIVFVLDETGSMSGAIANVKSQVSELTKEIDRVSAGDYRIGLLAFNDRDLEVLAEFDTRNAKQIRALVGDLSDGGFGGSGGSPEAWDEALTTVVDNRTAEQAAADSSLRDPQSGDFSVPWRDDAEKMIVLVTDAQAGGFDQDNDDDRADADRAYAAAVRAAGSNIRIATVFVPNGNHQEGAPSELQEVSNLTASTYFATRADAANLSEGLTLNVTTCAADSDGDGLFDIWETEGYDADGDGKVDVNLPKMGASPDHKDLFLQVNWQDPRSSPYFDEDRCWRSLKSPGWCPTSSAPVPSPDPDVLVQIVDTFAQAPVDNPDNKPGIRVHIDAGELSPQGSGIRPKRRRGGPVPEALEALFSKGSTAEEQDEILGDLESKHLPASRTALFTWVLYAQDIFEGSGIMGWAPGTPGDTVLISRKRTPSKASEAVTLMHELGHTLGLRHGGLDDVNGKPNYLSIMNYDFARRDGLFREGTGGILDYSRYSLAELDERSLDEPAGLAAAEGPAPTGLFTVFRCTGDTAASANGSSDEFDLRRSRVDQPIDWNCNGKAGDTEVSGAVHDIWWRKNDDNPHPDGLRILTSRNDWATLTFTGGSRGGLESPPGSEPATDEDFTYDNWRNTPKDYAIAVTGPGQASTDAGSGLARLIFTLENVGELEDTYQFDVEVSGDWEPAVTAPATVTVGAGGSTSIPVDVPVPAEVGEGDTVMVKLKTRSTNAEWVAANTPATLSLGSAAEFSPAGSLSVDPTEPRAGSSFTITAAGFAPGGQAIVASEKNWFEPVAAQADDAGRVSVIVQAPGEPGSGEISVTGEAPPTRQALSDQPDDAGEAADTTDPDQDSSTAAMSDPSPPRLLASTVTITASPLPWVLAGAGALALVIGAAVLLLIRRRRRQREAS